MYAPAQLARLPLRLSVILALVLLPACASTGGGSDGEATRGGRNRIIQAELLDHQQLNAYQAIERLRPRWLRQPLGRVAVPVVNGNPQRSSGLSVLQSIRVTDIQEMRFMSASDATTRYGTGFDGGAILVETKR